MNADQYDIFGNGKSTDEIQVENAILLLVEKGYRVIKTGEEAAEIAIESGYRVSDPIIVDEKIVNLKDLRNHFYKRLTSKHPDRSPYYIEGNWQQEMRYFKLFVESREKLGLNRFNAVQECAALIDVIFDHEEEFGFKRPIDIRVLGQGKSGWITHKAAFILNEKLLKKQKLELECRIESIEQEISDEIDMNEVSKDLDDLLNKMEANNG